MLTRTQDFASFLGLSLDEAATCRAAARRAGDLAAGMTHERDYEALAAIALRYKPKRIFEIGTYLGVTSDFLLQLLPSSVVVSIAYRPHWLRRLLGAPNNTDLPVGEIGRMVESVRRDRFVQIYGNSHGLTPAKLMKKYGAFDMVFVDGDHSYKGVMLDTLLARRVLSEDGVICWHDANPKPKYQSVREYLERGLDLDVIATEDNYVGGVAVWHKTIGNKSVKHDLLRYS